MPPRAAVASAASKSQPQVSGNPSIQVERRVRVHDITKEYKMAASGNTTVKAVEIPVDSPVRLVRQWDRRASEQQLLSPASPADLLYHYKAEVSVQREIEASSTLVPHAYLSMNALGSVQPESFALGQAVVLTKPYKLQCEVGDTVRQMALPQGAKLEIACEKPVSYTGNVFMAANTGRHYYVRLLGPQRYYPVKEWQRGSHAIAYEDVVLVEPEKQ